MLLVSVTSGVFIESNSSNMSGVFQKSLLQNHQKTTARRMCVHSQMPKDTSASSKKLFFLLLRGLEKTVLENGGPVFVHQVRLKYPETGSITLVSQKAHGRNNIMQHGYVSKSRATPPHALYMIHFRRKPLDFLLMFNLVNLFRRKRTRHTREYTFGKNLHSECSILICHDQRQIGWLALHCSFSKGGLPSPWSMPFRHFKRFLLVPVVCC